MSGLVGYNELLIKLQLWGLGGFTPEFCPQITRTPSPPNNLLPSAGSHLIIQPYGS